MLKRFRRAFLLAISTSVIVMALVFVVAKAGSITPSGPVGSTMHSLAEIYDILAGTYDSSGQLANIDGNIIEQLKYISANVGAGTLQQAYDNSGVTPTINDSSDNTILTLKQTGAGNIFDLQNGSGSLFSVSNLGLISGATGKIQAATGSTFYNEGGYAIAKAGEEILRASIPIFGYDFPARYANSAVAVKISRDILLDVDDTTALPAVPAGATRKYKFKIQYSTDLAMSGNSVWQIKLEDGSVFGAPFNVPSTEIASLSETKVYYTPIFSALPDHVIDGKWYLTVIAPNLMTIQVFQIELLAYDVPNAGT